MFVHQEFDIVRMAVVGGRDVEEEAVAPGAFLKKRNDIDINGLQHLAGVVGFSIVEIHVHGNQLHRQIPGALSHAVEGGVHQNGPVYRLAEHFHAVGVGHLEIVVGMVADGNLRI